MTTLPATPNGPELPAAPRGALTPYELLNNAIERGVDLPMLEKLMDLQERHEDKQARRAFDAAIADAKAKIPIIKKNREGNNKTRYADFSAFARAIDPVLAEHGLSYRFRTRQDERIHVTCILAHRDGHAEENTLSGAPDTTGNKNAIQAIGSALSYLQRYSLCGALGLSAADDDDGKTADGDEPITDEQAQTIRDKIDATGADIERFCRYIGVEAVPEIRQSKFAAALKALDAKAKKPAKAGAAA